MTNFNNQPSKMIGNHFRPVLTALAVLALVSGPLSGCSHFKKIEKAETHKPAKLVKLAQPINVLRPIFKANLGHKSSNTTSTLGLQPVFTGQYIITATPMGELGVFNINNQQKRWSRKLNSGIVGGVAYDTNTNTAIVTTRSGQVLAFDVATGEQKWQQQLSGTVLAPALIEQNRVLLSANDGILHGLSLQTGQSIWQFSTQVPNISVRGTAKPVLLDDKVALFATADGRIHAISIIDGLPLWSRQVGVPTGTNEIDRMRDIDGSPIIDNNQLFAVSYSGQLVGINLLNRSLDFVQDVASLHSVALLGNVLVATAVDGDVVAFNRENGDLLWKNDALKYRELTNPVRIGSYIAIGDFDGVIHIFDAQGKIVSRVETKGSLTHLMTQGNYLLAQTTSGQVTVWQY